MTPEEYYRDYMNRVMKAIDNLPMDKLVAITNALLKARENDSTVFVCGNGGSASTASHMVCDLGKGANVDGLKRFKVICLNDNIPMITAWSNDADYEQAYVQQLENFLREGDLVIGISGSGNSANVLNAIQFANDHGATTIGMTGFQGGKLVSMAQIYLVVPSNNMERIEDIHLVIEHMVKLFIKLHLEEGQGST